MDDYVIAIIVVVLLLVIFYEQVCVYLAKANKLLMGKAGKKEGATALSIKEKFEDGKVPEGPHPREDEGKYMNMDTSDGSWSSYARDIDVEPVVQLNHQDFVKNTRNFSNGAAFTTVSSDNTNLAFTNFVGLRRNVHVPIGPDARQQPDIDASVLQRNERRKLKW